MSAPDARLTAIAQTYGPERLTLVSASGAAVEAAGPGGQLQQQVDALGASPLAATLHAGEQVILEDAGVRLEPTGTPAAPPCGSAGATVPATPSASP